MKVSLFLGAGASTSYWMPTTLKLKEELAERRAKDAEGGGAGSGGEPDVWSDLLSDSNGLDIEHVLLLADTVDALYRTERGRHLIANSGRLGRTLKEVMGVGREARREVFRRYAWDHDLDENARDLLGPLVRMAMSMNGNWRVSVFTTNYDKAVESFCEEDGITLHDGFKLDVKTGRRAWAGDFGCGDKAAAPGAVGLYKLHGSLDWKRNGKHGALRVDYDGRSDSEYYRDVLIHPSLADKKGEIKTEPYKTIHDSFKRELESSDACIVVGFSFRDDPIASVFRRFAEGDGKTLIVVGPDAKRDVHRSILEGEPPGEDGKADEGTPAMVAARTRHGVTRRAAVIGQKWTELTTDEIAVRARSAIEARVGLRPVHTLGSCTECVKKLTLGDMTEHVQEHLNWQGGREALLFRAEEYAVGAPWMFVLARPGSTLGDLEKFLQKEWIAKHYPHTESEKVKFTAGPRSGDLDTGMDLSDVYWKTVQVYYSGMGRLQVDAMGSVSVRDMDERVRALAVGEKPPFE